MTLARNCLILTFVLLVIPVVPAAQEALGGIGVKIGMQGDGAAYPTVMEILPGGAAAKSGIGVGDRLVGIVDEAGSFVDFQGKEIVDVAALMRGPSGSTFRLVVETKVSDERKLYELIRSQAAEAPAVPQKSVQAPAESRLALVIGNADYREASLANPVNDARDIASALSALGFRVLLKENANRQAMRLSIREFGDSLKASGGVGLFYFAGHGMQVKGRNFLVPIGEDIGAEDEVEDQSVGIDLVLDKMEAASNRVNIVILDACRNNPFQRRFRSASRGLAPLDAARGSYIAFSTAPGSVAADGTGRNGVYTRHLLDNLRHAESSIESVFKRVRVAVLSDTSNRQVPWESSSLTGDFYFNPLQRADPAASGLAPAPPAQDSAPGNRARLESGAGSPATSAGTVRVHFFRESGFIGSALNYRIEHNGKVIGNLGNGAYFSYDSAPGQQSFTAVGNFGRGGTFTLESGQAYYIELNVVPFSASLRLVTQERGGEAIRSMR